MPNRIQRKRTKGWRMPENAVYVGRPTAYGNPFKIGEDGNASQCVARFRAAWDTALRLSQQHPRQPPMPFDDPVFLGPLRGKDLACWCRLDEPCHADVLLEIANG
jgi:hypothetical protein